MNPLRKLLAILLFSYLAYIIGCDRGPVEKPATGPKPIVGGRIVFIGPAQDDPRSEAVLAGARRVAAQVSYLRFEFLGPPATDRSMNLRMASDALHSGAVGVCVYLYGADDFAPLTEELRTSGIVLVTMGAVPRDIAPYQHINIDLAGGAEMIAENLSRCAAGRKTYALVHARSRSAIDHDCYERFISHRPGDSQMVQVAERDAFDPPELPSRIIADIVASFRSTAIVVTLSPEVWLTTEPPFALDEGRRFITLGAVEPLWPRLKNGEAAAIVGPLDGEIGAAAMQGVLRGVAREPAEMSLRTIPCHFVTPETLDDFARNYRMVMSATQPSNGKGQ